LFLTGWLCGSINDLFFSELQGFKLTVNQASDLMSVFDSI